jgi:transglutaminase-like putative cysteine protease
MENYLKPTEFLDSDHPRVREFAERHTASTETDTEKAISLYYAVRDGFQYDPYGPHPSTAPTGPALSLAMLW